MIMSHKNNAHGSSGLHVWSVLAVSSDIRVIRIIGICLLDLLPHVFVSPFDVITVCFLRCDINSTQ